MYPSIQVDICSKQVDGNATHTQYTLPVLTGCSLFGHKKQGHSPHLWHDNPTGDHPCKVIKQAICHYTHTYTHPSILKRNICIHKHVYEDICMCIQKCAHIINGHTHTYYCAQTHKRKVFIWVFRVEWIFSFMPFFLPLHKDRCKVSVWRTWVYFMYYSLFIQSYVRKTCYSRLQFAKSVVLDNECDGQMCE